MVDPANFSPQTPTLEAQNIYVVGMYVVHVMQL